MKKQYIVPAFLETELRSEQIIATSIPEYEDGGGEQLVKEQADDRALNPGSGNLWNSEW